MEHKAAKGPKRQTTSILVMRPKTNSLKYARHVRYHLMQSTVWRCLNSMLRCYHSHPCYDPLSAPASPDLALETPSPLPWLLPAIHARLVGSCILRSTADGPILRVFMRVVMRFGCQFAAQYSGAVTGEVGIACCQQCNPRVWCKFFLPNVFAVRTAICSGYSRDPAMWGRIRMAHGI